MFTGIIEETGEIIDLSDHGITVRAQKILDGIALGDSIAVGGICLTVTRYDAETFSAGLSPETVRRSTLARRRPGDRVNLEGAMRAGGKLGGHFVSGHVDGVGHCLAVRESGEAWEMEFEAPEAVARYIVEKGSIAVDGVSLTVAGCSPTGDRFTIAVIPHSFDHTTLAHLRPGDPVNLEADLLGKYVEKLLRPQAAVPERITREFLAEHGYA